MGPLSQDNIDDIRLKLVTGVLNRGESLQPLEITSNSCDIKGAKTTIRSKNLDTIQTVKDIMSSSTIYQTIDESDLPGIRVKILLPGWFDGLIKSNQMIKVITLHHPTVKDNFNQYQPPKTLENGSILIYLTLDYTAQIYFSSREWKLHLLGTTLNICDADARKKRNPTLQEDGSPNIGLDEMSLQPVVPNM